MESVLVLVKLSIVAVIVALFVGIIIYATRVFWSRPRNGKGRAKSFGRWLLEIFDAIEGFFAILLPH